MKQSILRIVCAFVLMTVALGVSVGILVGAKQPEPVYVWQSVTFVAPRNVELFSESGVHLQTLNIDETKRATSKLLPEGRYYAFSGDICVEFTLYNDRRLSVEGGYGWTDGKILHLTNEPVGNVRVEFLSESSTFYTFTLTKGSFCRRQIVRAREGDTVCCNFYGVPYGSYLLFRGQTLVSHVDVNANMPLVSIALAQ